ncbi:MAG: rmlD [Betaproteobacteria bacterium]|nr:rmlD [Betaproteobacteria bacterium]
MTRILLTGATGQVGWELARALAPLGEILSPPHKVLDLARPETLAAAVDVAQPDVIVNAAAYTAVDQAERETASAMAINADAPLELAKAARKHRALLVHYSTDYVFDGRKESAYEEYDAPNPLSTYGRSKLAGDVAIRESGADHLIFRTSWVYASRGKNFLLTMLRLAGEREQLRIVNDQVGAPTWSRLIAVSTGVALRHELARRREGKFVSDVFNLTAGGEVSWHGFATAIIAALRQHGMPMKCREVMPITTDEYPLPAQRPANSRLSTAKIAKQYGLHLPEWDRCMNLCLAEVIADRGYPIMAAA